MPPPVPKLLEVERLGRSAYADAHALQERRLAQRIAGEIPDTLLLTEHEPVVTVGRGGSSGLAPAELAAAGLPVVAVERGGEATYHGPGQVVAYPILALEPERRDLHRYLRDLEQVVIEVLAEFEVEGVRRPGLTGVWIGARKVASIGVAVRRWVTWHGFALNLATDLGAFRAFRPCGLDPEVMTRLADHVELPPARLLVEVLIVKHVCAVFGLELPAPGSRGGGEPSAGAGDGPPRLPQLPILPG